MTALFSATESAGKDSASSNIVPPSGHCVCQSGEEAGVGNIRSEEVHAYLANADLQDLLAIIAASPARTPDRAGGVLDQSDPSVIRVPLINAEGRYALIDAEDYPLIQRYRWRLDCLGKYAVCTCGKDQLRMHRQIMIVCGESDVDHKNHDGLDNRTSNLRVCSHAENMWNMRRSSRNTTGVKGVVAKGERYMATVTARKVVHFEMFDTLEQATAWVTATRGRLHGKFACYGDSAGVAG